MNEELLKELKNISILYVEDETGIRETVVNTLKYYFKEVYEACDGNEGFELYEYYKPKIVLSDIQMKDCIHSPLAKEHHKPPFALWNHHSRTLYWK